MKPERCKLKAKHILRGRKSVIVCQQGWTVQKVKRENAIQEDNFCQLSNGFDVFFYFVMSSCACAEGIHEWEGPGLMGSTFEPEVRFGADDWPEEPLSSEGIWPGISNVFSDGLMPSSCLTFRYKYMLSLHQFFGLNRFECKLLPVWNQTVAVKRSCWEVVALDPSGRRKTSAHRLLAD